MSFWAVVMGLVLLIAYLTMPDMFHDFFGYITQFLFDTLYDAFGTDGPSTSEGQDVPESTKEGK